MPDDFISNTAGTWVASAMLPGCEFPLQNLPFCTFSSAAGDLCLGVGIGDEIFNLKRGVDCTPLSSLPTAVKEACRAPVLNDLMKLGAGAASTLRDALLELFASTASPEVVAAAKQLLSPMAQAQYRLPVAIGNFTDFYASLHHATNVGRMFRPDQPLLPNYKYVPIGYHGRASSVQVSGTPVVRPSGQLKPPDAPTPTYAGCRQLDFELELACYVGAGNSLGETIAIHEADQHIFGFSLLNDWSARDIQSWEYQPLGPFLSKSFMTTVSPWVVPLQALEAYRIDVAERPAGDPAALPYLTDTRAHVKAAFNIQVEAFLLSAAMREAGAPAQRLTRANATDLYWSFAQMLTHHASNGCNLQPGDLLGSGTISGASERSCGSMLELTRRGTAPLVLDGGESRTFLEDGDEVILRAFCERPGLPRIGFGECRGVVQPAR